MASIKFDSAKSRNTISVELQHERSVLGLLDKLQ
jgi:hypothetical protein